MPLPGSSSPPNVTLYQIVFEKMRVSEDQCLPALTHVHHMHCSWASHALATGITHADYAYTHAGHGYHTHCSWALHALLTGITRADHGHHTCWPLASRTSHGHHTHWPWASHALTTGITRAGHGHHTRWPQTSHALVTGITCTSHGHLSLPPSCSLHVTSVLSPILILSLYSTDTNPLPLLPQSSPFCLFALRRKLRKDG